MTDWLPTLITQTPAEGYDLAVKLSRVAIKLTQPDAAVRDRLRPDYAEDPDAGSGQNMGVMPRVFCLRRSADHRELRPL